MLNDAFANIYTKPINLLWPSLAIGLTCIALALLGNALRDELERSGSAPKRKRKGGAGDPRRRSAASRSSSTRRAGEADAARCCWRSATCRSATTSPTAR